jgi:inosine-uridine nucleoside N-ribohydrolase
MTTKPIPVILDTDIGGDMDDTWALIMLLRSPEVDIKLITTTSDFPEARARFVGRLLEIAGRTDIPIGIGVPIKGGILNNAPMNMFDWVRDYSLYDYPGNVYEDGADAFIRTIKESPEPVTVIAIGPLSTIGEALRRAPDLIENSRFVGMYGSLYKGYCDSDQPCAETNVREHNQECRLVFESDWDLSITPLDSCGLVDLEGALYERILGSEDPLVKALMEINQIFAANVKWMTYDPTQRSSILFDTVAVYMAFSEELLTFQTLPIKVTEDGRTLVDPAGKQVRCAMSWKDLEAFKTFLVQRILGEC